ncbi:MAG: PAS domain S-box protein, partial [Campylobacterales bacterium]|nr:PAS domain S-box protein [Campylobacterales bacterium]
EHYLKKELDALVKGDLDIFAFIESASLDGIWYWNLEKPEDEYMSPTFWKLFGYEPEEKEHLASAWQDMIYPDDLQNAKDKITKHLSDPNYPYDQIVRYTQKDGSTVWVRCRGIAIRDKEGKPIRMLGAHNDYTALKRAQEQERAKHQQLANILDASLDGIMAFESVYDEQGELVDFRWTVANTKACEMVGIAQENLLGKRLSEIMRGNFEPLESLEGNSLFEHYKAVATTGKPVNLEFYYEHNGLQEWFHNKAVKHEDGFVVTFESITQAKNAQEQLKESEFLWKMAIEANGDGLWDWNLANDEIYYSPRYKSMLGYEDDELLDSVETFKQLCHPDHIDDVFDKLTNYLEGKIERFEVKFQLRCKDGIYKWIQGKGTIAKRDQEGMPLRVLGTHRDITKEYEKDLQLNKIAQQLTEAQHTAKLGSWTYDIVEEGLEWSDEVFNIFGLDKQRFKPSYEAFLSLIHPNDRERVDEVFKDSVANKTPYSVEHRVITQNGIEKFVREKGYTIYDKSGKPLKTIGTVQDISEEIKLQEEIHKEKNFISTIIENSNAIIAVIDNQGVMRRLNRYGQEFVGYDIETISSKPYFWTRFLPQYQQEDIINIFKQAQDGEIVKSYTNSWFSKDGEERVYEWSNTIVFKEDGSLDYVASIGIDITQREKAEKGINKEKKKFEALLEKATDAIFIMDIEDGSLIEYSANTKKLLGYSNEELKKLSVLDWDKSFGSIKEYQEIVAAIGYETLSLERTHTRKDGSTYIASITASRVKIDNQDYIYASTRDITQDKKHQLELETLNDELNLFKQVIDNTNTGIVISDATIEDMPVIYANKAFENLTQYTKEDTICQNCRILQGEDRDQEARFQIREALDNQKPISVEIRNYKKDGELFWNYLVLTPLFDRDKKLKYYVGVQNDITLLKETANKLRLAKESAEKANQAKSTFLANMSHEIRTPLNGVIGLTDLVLQSNLDERQKDYLTKAKISSKALLHVINDILDYSKIEAGKLDIVEDEFSFEALLLHLNDLFGYNAYQKGITLNFFVDHTLPPMLVGDALRITQILNNLVGNALKFTYQGHVSIYVNKTFIDKPNKRVGLSICVEDSGIGIPQSKQHKLFRAFEQGDNSTTKEFGGSGLGLMISKELVTLMGGEITMQSQEGEGSKFCIDLSLYYTQEDYKFDKIEEIAQKRFLIVDDCALDREYIQNILNAWGIATVSASDGVEALKIAQKESIDYAIVDWFMPNMDGLELIKALNTNGISLEHIFMVTAHDTKELLEKARDENIEIEKILHKPYTPSSLYNLLIDNQKVFEFRDDEEVLDSVLTQPKRALVVEDNEINQIVIEQILQNLGFEVAIAQNGHEAYKMAKSRGYDIILMDLQMPIMDGFEATQKIRAFDSAIPIYALSAAVMKEDKRLTKQAGMNGHLAKPIDKSKLYRVLQKHFAFKETQKKQKSDTHSINIEGINRGALRQRFNDDEAFIDKMLMQFVASHQDTPQKLQKMDIDSQAFNQTMHTLKGVMGNLSMDELYTLAKSIYESKDSTYKASKRAEFIDKLEKMIDSLSSMTKPLPQTPILPHDKALDTLQHYREKLSTSSYINETQQEELYAAVVSLANLGVAREIQATIDRLEYTIANEMLESIIQGTSDE